MAYFVLTPPNGEPPARYEVPKTMTIREQKEVIREFGAEAAGLGVIWIAVRREYPDTKPTDIDECTVELVEEEDDKLPPTFYGGNGSSQGNAKPTEPANTGIPGSDTSSA